ncbi:DUF427 domain-containing protein [Salinivirga cyanobacteriivorans]
MRVIWNNQLIAESDKTIVVENNYYFPPESIHQSFFEQNSKETFCPWKGKASYYNLIQGEDKAKAEAAAWYYPEPKDAASNIKNHVAFDKSVVKIEDN